MSIKKIDIKMKRITLKPGELLIIDAPENCIVNAESTYGYGLGGKTLEIRCTSCE